jgi:hypothetical protein
MTSNSLLSQARTLRRVYERGVLNHASDRVGMVLLVVSSTVGYKKSSLRKCATYGRDFIVKENNRKLRDQCVSIQVHVTETV